MNNMEMAGIIDTEINSEIQTKIKMDPGEEHYNNLSK